MNIFSDKLKFKNRVEKKIDNNYYYNIKEHLENIYTNDFKDVYMCFFFIDTTQPILKYFLDKKKFNFFNVNIKTFIKSDCINVVKNIFGCEFSIMGYKPFQDNMYLFIQIYNDEINNNGEWCIMDEICNKKKKLNNSISENVSNYFLNNTEFIYLRNKDNLKIEIPIVMFQNCDNLLELMYFKHNNNKTKKYYDYNNCKKKYILRYILFLSDDSIVFNKKYQYFISYLCKPESVHE